MIWIGAWIMFSCVAAMVLGAMLKHHEACREDDS